MRWSARSIAIVGPDGSGKTTQAQLLVQRLQAAGYDAQYVHALYYLSNAFPYADWFRKRAGPRRMRTERRETEGLLYRVSQVLFSWFSYWFAVITILCVSLRSRNQIIVYDRYYHQFFYDVYGPASLSLSRRLPVPWRTIYLDAELDVIRTRLRAMDQFADDAYYVLVIDHYNACATEDWLRYPAELSVRTLHEQIFKEIQQNIEASPDGA